MAATKRIHQNLRLSNILDEAARTTPDKACAVLFDDKQFLSFRRAYQALRNHQDWLRQQLSIVQDSNVVVAYLSNNTLDFILSVLACTSDQVKGLPALLNTRWTAQEMVAALQLDYNNNNNNNNNVSGSRTLLLYGTEWKETAQRIQQLAPHVQFRPIPDFARRSLSKELPLLQDGSEYNLVAAPSSTGITATTYSRDDALVVFTSGTSQGRPKGARLSHAAIAVQAAAKCQPPCSYSSRTALLASTVPFFHIGGLSSLVAVWMAGGRLVLPKSSSTLGFSAPQVWRSIQTHYAAAPLVTTLVVVPAMLYSLQEEYNKERCQARGVEQYPSMELILVGGQSISEAQGQFLASVFPRARIVQTYACTEAASSLTFHTVKKTSTSTSLSHLQGDCVGVAPAHVELCLADQHEWKQNGILQTIRQPHKAGIIATRGPHVMSGYWQRQGGIKRGGGLTTGGWFVTNDLGFWDQQGRLYFCGRANDAIRTGGETVLAAEVERVVAKHPHVAECAIFALPDDRFGQAVSCAVVLKERGKIVSLETVRKWCQQQGLAGFKGPRRLYIVDQLPKNSSGKTLKFRLVEKFGTNPRSRL